MPLIQIVSTLFILANPIGSIPLVIALIKDFDIQKQKKIMLRESFIALIIALVFQYLGEIFLNHLHVKIYSLTLCGGVLLLIVAMSMIFSPKATTKETAVLPKEPVFVPIATPLIAGPGILTLIMLISGKEPNALKITSGILIAWTAITAVLVMAPYIKRILHRNLLVMLEQLMGLTLTLMATQMIINGIADFLKVIQ